MPALTANPVVLFIGGYGRSGSTLLDRLLGGYGDGVVSAGEMRHIWREGMLEDRRCGCGSPFSTCPFWQQVLAVAFGRGGAPVHDLLALQSAVDRSWRIGHIATGRPAAFASELERYGDALAAVLRGVATVSGARVVVDSSKDPSHGWILRGAPGIDLRVVELDRDPRAVAWSWQRRRLHPGSGQDMDRFSPARTAAGWLAVRALIAALRRSGPPSTVVRYEHLVTRPDRVVGDLLEFVGADPGGAAPLASGRAVLGEDHTVAGNPIRFRRGPIDLRADDEWRRAMPATSRALVAGITAPGRALGTRAPRGA